jgi:hypothetical protein
MSFQSGRLCAYDIVNVKAEETGNAISGNVDPQLQISRVSSSRTWNYDC